MIEFVLKNGVTEEEVMLYLMQAMLQPKILEALQDKKIKKVIAIKDKLINIVTA